MSSRQIYFEDLTSLRRAMTEQMRLYREMYSCFLLDSALRKDEFESLRVGDPWPGGHPEGKSILVWGLPFTGVPKSREPLGVSCWEYVNREEDKRGRYYGY